jgi:hypothetical protein
MLIRVSDVDADDPKRLRVWWTCYPGEAQAGSGRSRSALFKR